MARHGERLPYASFSGNPPPLYEPYCGDESPRSFTSNHWDGFEYALGKTVLIGAREQFESLCCEYLTNEKLERTAVRVADVRRCASETKKALAPFTAFAYGSHFAHGEPDPAWREFRELFDEAIARYAIPATIDQGDGDKGTALFLSPSMLTEIAIRISACLSTIAQGGQSEVFEDAQGIEIGAALQSFLKDARAWAKDHGLPHSAMKSVDDSAAPFAAFLYAVTQVMPGELRPNVDSAAAMAGHLKRKS